ncbi:DNA repair protein RAD51 [Mycotypha africana]|uniref:DNA repair protein RAD51 n=1 Tax=Mycotypha africana TaxID=64632 RepID=UPI00230081AC|nr:DNA repair protein RAD51 [Mycotypha africana]KAI8975224.1 DNA repair protein RAD51 [Mycotypha africana]
MPPRKIGKETVQNVTNEENERQSKRLKTGTGDDAVEGGNEIVFDLDNLDDEKDDLANHLICELEKHGVSATDVKKLEGAGFFTVYSVLYAPRKKVLDVKGLSEARVDKIIKECEFLGSTSILYFYLYKATFELAYAVTNYGGTTAYDIMQRRDRLIRITTGSREFDQLLGGGIETGSITEIFGENRCGKTQICHTLAVACQLPFGRGGGQGRCFFVDTEGTFRPDRISSIAARFDLDPATTLGNIAVYRANNTDQQLTIVTEAADTLAKARFSLIVVDSAISLYRRDYVGRGELAARQMHLGQFLHQLQHLADEFGAAVVITNQMTATVDGSAGIFAVNPMKPTGGNIMGHATCTRLQLRKGKAENRIVKVYKSPCLPESEASFAISEEGIVDAA